MKMDTFAAVEREEQETAARGGWILTYTGRQFYLHDPKPEDVCIEDIGHALSMLCRFTGHCARFYSVAEHSLLVTRGLPRKFWAWGLLHDAAEAYVNDLARPLKCGAALDQYRNIENRILQTIFERFGLHPGGVGVWVPSEVKRADLQALATERRDLMPAGGPEWELGVEPFDELIPVYERAGIKLEFLRLCAELGLE
jgi:hypothetical protein